MKVYVCFRICKRLRVYFSKSVKFDGSYFFLVICIFKIIFGYMNCVLDYV